MKKLLAAIAIAVASVGASANQTVELVLPAPPGGPSGRIAQILLPKAQQEFAKHGKNLVLSHRPGGATIVASNSVAAAKPGELQILVLNNTLITAPMFNPGIATYDVAKDFVVVGYLGSVPNIVVTNPASGLNTAAAWQAACARKPLSYGSAGAGTTAHLYTQVVNQAFKCNGINAIYKGISPAITDLLGGHIDYFTGALGDVMPLIEGGKLTPIMVLDNSRLTQLPNVPTVTELGVKDYDYYNWWALHANATASAADLALAKQIFKQVIESPDVLAQLREFGLRGQKTVAADFLAKEKRIHSTLLQSVPRPQQ